MNSFVEGLKGGCERMMKLVFCFLAFGFLIAGVSAQGSNDTMIVRADIVESSVGISVPNSVFFGSVTAGYVSDRKQIDIANTGTVDIRVVPELEPDYTEGYFEYIGFRNVLDDPLELIGDFELEIEKPSAVGGERTENVYMYLDLSSYPDEITETIKDHQAEVIFWAIPV
jgi:hypothetical protein